MKCWHCNSELIWGCGFDAEDLGMDKAGIVSNLSCSNDDCNTDVEIIHLFKAEDDDDTPEDV